MYSYIATCCCIQLVITNTIKVILDVILITAHCFKLMSFVIARMHIILSSASLSFVGDCEIQQQVHAIVAIYTIYLANNY